MCCSDSMPVTSKCLSSCASISSHCDDNGVLSVSTDGGSSWTVSGTSIAHKDVLQRNISNITSSTVLRFECEDTGFIGGFISTVEYDGVQYSTTKPINESNWQLTNASSGVIFPSALVYHNKTTSSPWNINTDSIADDASWIWNDEQFNTLTFEFDFANIVSAGIVHKFTNTVRSQTQ